ncbi:Hypothetical protein SCF082_LOCUS23171 [Durusdinium trenchii]|uniref:Glycosyl transferase family 25 domain-containing protein n=1 Tax=Durusdinium trenchii TaxID=1381693 RepID=A0ABP0LK80_9DINO
MAICPAQRVWRHVIGLLCLQPTWPASTVSTDWLDGRCAPHAALLPPEACAPRAFPEQCATRTPVDSSWVWPGRNWCWVATKRHACYGHHTWEEAAEVAEKEMEVVKATEGDVPLRRPELCDVRAHGRPLKPNETASVQQRTSFRIEAAEASFWFDRNVAVYVVSLPSAVLRWNRMQQRLQELEINVQRVDGIDLASASGLEAAKKEGLVPFGWNYTAAKETMVRLLQKSSKSAAERYLENYGLGTVGCAAAHLRALWTAASAWHARKPLVLILEDDVWLEEDFKLKVRKLLKAEAPCDWQVISLRSQCPYGTCVSPHLTRVQPDGNEPEEMCRHGVNYGFYAMLYQADALIFVANALHQEIWNSSTPGCLANDVALAQISDRVAYYAVPSSQEPGFVQHGHFPSVRSVLNQQTSAAWLDQVLQKKRSSQVL